jgi:hypothetical protein
MRRCSSRAGARARENPRHITANHMASQKHASNACPTAQHIRTQPGHSTYSRTYSSCTARGLRACFALKSTQSLDPAHRTWLSVTL